MSNNNFENSNGLYCKHQEDNIKYVISQVDELRKMNKKLFNQITKDKGYLFKPIESNYEDINNIDYEVWDNYKYKYT